MSARFKKDRLAVASADLVNKALSKRRSPRCESTHEGDRYDAVLVSVGAKSPIGLNALMRGAEGAIPKAWHPGRTSFGKTLVHKKVRPEYAAIHDQTFRLPAALAT